MSTPEDEALSLLLVEDSPLDVLLVKEALAGESFSFRLEVADDGEKAIQLLDRVDAGSESWIPNMLLLDVNLPLRSGAEVLQRLRQSPRCGDVPAVMFSSSDSPAERQRAFELGASEYFRKPSSLGDFMKLGSLIRRLHEEGRGYRPAPVPENGS